jgi:hypothetical protein
MTRRQLHRSLARRTGEPLSVLRRLGFQFHRLAGPARPARRCLLRSKPVPTAVR